MTTLESMLVVPVAIAAASLTLSRGKIFRKQRLWLKKRAPWLGALLSCPYCVSHWIAAAAYIAYPKWLFTGSVLGDFLLGVFYLVGTSALFSGLIMRLIAFAPDDDPLEEAAKLLHELKGHVAK